MTKEGTLYKNSNGKWCVNGTELTSGDVFETVECEDCCGFVKVRLEYDLNIKDYYTVPKIELYEGLRARVSI